MHKHLIEKVCPFLKIFSFFIVKEVLGEEWLTNELFRLGTSVSNKVDKISGKGLSTNDYTTEEKAKLEGRSERGHKLSAAPSE